MNTLRAGWVITLRDLAHWVRQPWTPIFGLLFTIMLLLVFGFLFGGAITVPGGGDYITFLLPGMMALSMMFGVESTTTAMANDARKGITDRFRSLPIGSASVSLGRVGADMANSAVELLVLILGGLLIGWRISSVVRCRRSPRRRRVASAVTCSACTSATQRPTTVGSVPLSRAAR